MRSAAWVAGLGLLAIAGCAGESSDGPTSGMPGVPVAAVHETYGEKTNVYAVGPGGLQPGVYTTPEDCYGSAASTVDFDLLANDPDMDDEPWRGSDQVGDLRRIVLKHGEFFSTGPECTWIREDGTDTVSPDPATKAGACAILVGEGALVERAVGALRGSTEPLSWEVQEELMAVVFSRTPGVWRPAGELVDFLDAPEAFVVDGKLAPRVTAAQQKIREICR